MISKAAVRAFLERELDDFTWMKEASRKEMLEIIHETNPKLTFKTEPRLYQLPPIYLGMCFDGFLYFLGLGAGKTLCAIYVAQHRKLKKQINKTLVIVPSPVNVEGWMEEIELHSDFKAVPLLGSADERFEALEKNGDLYIINYAGLQSVLTNLKKVEGEKNRKRVIDPKLVKHFASKFDMVIMDEIHKVRHATSLTYRMCNQISKHCKYRLGLTGTPIGRDPADFWTQFYLTDHGATLGQTKGLFTSAFFNTGKDHWGAIKTTLDPKKSDLLHRTLRHRSIRYSDEELTDLPPLVEHQIGLNLSAEAKSFYTDLITNQLSEVKEGDKKSTQNYYSKMRQIASGFIYTKDDLDEPLTLRFGDNQKIEALREILEDVDEGSKVVIFHVFNESGESIGQLLKEMKIKYSAVNSTTKDSVAEYKRFKTNDRIKVLVANIESGGTGLNLQNANYVIIYEPTDKPITDQQAIKRVHRQGQKKHTYFYRLIVKNSVEEKILGFIREGKSLFDMLVEGKINLKEVSGHVTNR